MTANFTSIVGRCNILTAIAKDAAKRAGNEADNFEMLFAARWAAAEARATAMKLPRVRLVLNPTVADISAIFARRACREAIEAADRAINAVYDAEDAQRPTYED